MGRSRMVSSAAALSGAAALLLAASSLASPVVDPTVPAKRDTEPIVLKGSQLPGFAVPANTTVKAPFEDLIPATSALQGTPANQESCQTAVDPSKLVGGIDPTKLFNGFDPTSGGIGKVPDPGAATSGGATYDPNRCPSQHYANADADTSAAQGAVLGAGTPTNRILGYRWDTETGRFKQIPLQVDEVFARYLDNSRSGFALYSGQDQHTTYAYDREGFRWTRNKADDPCAAQPDSDVAKDPVPGLDTNDEVAFMAKDAGPAAPAGTALPAGIQDARRVTIVDPTDKASASYVYVMRATADGPRPAYDASNGYVRYERDPNADRFALSQSSYKDYGNAPAGPYCDAKTGKQVLDPDGTPAIGQRRPLDGATVTTKRYRYRYDGRWLMTGIRISPDNGDTYGPNLVDRWKARAFAQDPSSETPCCGYEEEDSNWGGSGITLGEKVGPVRAIRETWGADSGTNVIRRETFYRDEMRMKTWLRVHVIPPLDGIYAQWDFRSGRVTRFFNPRTADAGGVAVDGKDDEVFGNLDDPCNDDYDRNDTGQYTQSYRALYKQLQACRLPYHQSVDVSDPTFSEANSALTWSEVTGPYGTIVDRYSADPADISPGGTAQSLLAVPYYRDDACFDDGTGADPGPENFPRDPTREKTTRAPDGSKRTCWDGKGVPDSDQRFWQGSIATHGLHLLFLADSDNARQTVPVDEIVAENRMVMLPGARDGSAGESYGRSFEKPLVEAVTPYTAAG